MEKQKDQTVAGLPRYAVLKSNSNNKYLCCTNLDIKGSIRVNGDDATSPPCKFELERAKSGGTGLLNIRSCYNNKYLVRGSSTSYFIKAGAAKPNEDHSQWSCTLFETIQVGGDAKRIKLRFVQTKKLAALFYGNPPSHNLTLYVAGSDTGVVTEFTVIDWESLLILPKHVAFKGDIGTYLAGRVIEGHNYLQFDCNDIGDPRAAFEIFPVGDGSVRIKSKYFNKFWRLSPNWIWADSSDTTANDKSTLFAPVKVGDDTVAFRNLVNKNYCKRLSADWKTSCLNAALPSITKEAILTVEELVYSRTVFNVKYRLNDARIYDENILTMVSREASNYNSESETTQLRLSYKETVSSTWERGVSSSLSVSTNMEAGIPLIVEAKIQVTATISGSFKWGDTKESSTEIETTQVVTVPPKTRVKASVIATKGKCDVPFTYTQRDVLADGRELIYEMDDGLYTGINTYNFQYVTTQHKL